MHKRKTRNLITVLAFALVTMLSLQPLQVFAHEVDPSIAEVQALMEEYDVTKHEAENIVDNMESAIEQLPELELGETVVLPVSENLILEATLEDNGIPIVSPLARSTYSRTVTSTLQLKNIVGATIVTLRGVGVFTTNGSTSRPTDAYGSHSALVWNVTNTSSSRGATAYNANVRVSFSGQFNIGVAPVSMTVQSFSKSVTIYCNAVGATSATWR